MSGCYVLDVMFTMLCEWATKADYHQWVCGKESSRLSDLRGLCGKSLDDIGDEKEEEDDMPPPPTNLRLLKGMIERVNATAGSRA